MFHCDICNTVFSVEKEFNEHKGNNHKNILISPEMMKGSYKLDEKKIPMGGFAEKKQEEIVLEQFEKKALEKLGGSIAFVLKKRPVWTGEDAEMQQTSE